MKDDYNKLLNMKKYSREVTSLEYIIKRKPRICECKARKRVQNCTQIHCNQCKLGLYYHVFDNTDFNTTLLWVAVPTPFGLELFCSKKCVLQGMKKNGNK